MLINIDMEKEAVAKDIINNKMIEYLFQKSVLLIIKISLNVLIVGGAEMLIAIKMNHQKVILGIIVIILLNSNIFREWNFRYRSFVRKNKADEESPWANIMIKDPVNPMYDIEKIPHSTNPIWATDE